MFRFGAPFVAAAVVAGLQITAAANPLARLRVRETVAKATSSGLSFLRQEPKDRA